MGSVTPLRRMDDGEGHQKHAGGRPSKYDPSFCETAEFILSQGPGYSIVSVCVALDIVISTFQNWQRDHPEFREAIQRGRLKGIFVGEKLFNDVCLNGGINPVQLNALRLGITNRIRALDDAAFRQEWLNPSEDERKDNAVDDTPDLSGLTDEELDHLQHITTKLATAKAPDPA